MDNSSETSIEQLAALQDLDRQLREKAEFIRTSEAELTELEEQLQEQRTKTQALQTERDTVDARRRELEAQLEDEEGKMKDRRMRLNRVRNEKELQALRREIEVSKEANQQAEEELLAILESLETLSATAAEAEGTLAELETTSATKIAQARTGVDQLAADLARERESRDRIAATLDITLRRKYEQIFERRGGTAVVGVRNGICQGCHMNLPPQFFNELQRSRDVRLCPNCHRILFWQPERLEPVDGSR